MGRVFSAFLLGYALTMVPAGALADRWGARVVPMAGLALSGALISIGARTTSPWVAAVALAFAMALVLSVEGPFWSTLTRTAGAASGTAGGVMNLGSNVGGLISPALTPWLATWIGWENALHVAAGLAVLAALLWLGIRAEARPQDATSGLAARRHDPR
jgi:ACS family glucarate transporter-like MFS transporter